MKEKLISLFFLLLFCTSTSLMAQTAIPPSQGNGTQNNPYRIASLENLYWISQNPQNWNKHYIQTSNINALQTRNWFNGQGWVPIGNSSTSFTGSYNGQNLFLDYLYINRTEDNQALFGVTQNANINNIDSWGFNINGSNNVGGIVGKGLYTTMDNIIIAQGIISGVTKIGGVSGSLGYSYIENSNSTTRVTGNSQVGGFIGIMTFSSIRNCSRMTSSNVSGYMDIGGIAGRISFSGINNTVSSSPVEGTQNIGGLIGQSFSSNIKNSSSNRVGHYGVLLSITGTSNIGGIVGRSQKTSINDCFSNGKVLGNSTVGGLVGYNQNSYISSCYTLGKIENVVQTAGGLIGTNSNSNITNCFSEKTVKSTYNAGGLVGRNIQGSTISNSFSNGDTINAYGTAGGLVASLQDSYILNSFSHSNVSGHNSIGGLVGYEINSTIDRTYSIGRVLGTYTGGLVGTGSSSRVTNSYWNTQTSGQTQSAGGIGRTTAQMRQQSTYQNWNFSTIWGINSGINNGFPYLRWSISSTVLAKRKASTEFDVDEYALSITDNEVNKSFSINIGPNPVSDYLSISFSNFDESIKGNNVNLRIFDSHNNLAVQKKIVVCETNEIIELKSTRPGLFIILLDIEGNNSYKYTFTKIE